MLKVGMAEVGLSEAISWSAHAMAAEMRSPNVSVTPINVEQAADLYEPSAAPASDSAVREPPDSATDAEVAQISDLHVHMRPKRERANSTEDVPRPMSWEGELSDGGNDMCVDEESLPHGPENLSLSQKSVVRFAFIYVYIKYNF